MKIKCTLFLFILTISLYSQENYSICKVDSSSQRIFIYTKRSFAEDSSNVKKIIADIELNYQSFINLNISFFDNKEDCGYQIETVDIVHDSMINIKSNNIKEHWFAEYSKQSGKIKYFKNDGSFTVNREYYIRKK